MRNSLTLSGKELSLGILTFCNWTSDCVVCPLKTLHKTMLACTDTAMERSSLCNILNSTKLGGQKHLLNKTPAYYPPEELAALHQWHLFQLMHHHLLLEGSHYPAYKYSSEITLLQLLRSQTWGKEKEVFHECSTANIGKSIQGIVNACDNEVWKVHQADIIGEGEFLSRDIKYQ